MGGLGFVVDKAPGVYDQPGDKAGLPEATVVLVSPISLCLGKIPSINQPLATWAGR